MYRTMKKDPGGSYVSTCPNCSAEVRAADNQDLTFLTGCKHVVRRWRVAKDGRVRIEFKDPSPAERTVRA